MDDNVAQRLSLQRPGGNGAMFSFLGSGGRGFGGNGAAGPDKFAVLAEVRAYWEALRPGKDLPRRDQIDPRGLAGALEQVFLLERAAPGVARFRLAGMRLNDLLGMDVRGMPVSAMIEPLDRARMAAALEDMFCNPCAMDLWLEAERGVGRPALAGRMILLPLVSSRGPADLVLGCLATQGDTGRAPRRFAISALLKEPLGIAAPPTRDRPHLVPAGLAEAPHPFAAAPQLPPPPRGVPHLRLVSSRD